MKLALSGLRRSTARLVAGVLVISLCVGSGDAVARYDQPHPQGPHRHAISATPIQSQPAAAIALLAAGEQPPASSLSGTDGPFGAAVSGCTTTTVDLKVLVVASDGTEFDLPAIRQSLDQLGTPYTVFTAAPRPTVDTTDRLLPLLASGCRGFFNGVILTTGGVTYFNGVNYPSALTPTEWTTLSSYEAGFGVRQVAWYAYPTADYGFGPLTATSNAPLSATLTTAGAAQFSYVKPQAQIAIKNSYVYSAPALDAATTTLLTDGANAALMAIRHYPNGRDNLALTFATSVYTPQFPVLAYGILNWLSNGVFIGERHVYLAPQVDDVFIADAIWPPGTACSTSVEDPSLPTYRITGNDLTQALAWQRATRSRPNEAQFQLAMAFNGVGTENPERPHPDTLTRASSLAAGELLWISHTYDHQELDALAYAEVMTELTENHRVATTTLALPATGYSTANLVTPSISGFNNPAFLQAAYDYGVRYLVGDPSRRTPYTNTISGAGVLQPGVFIIPRHPVSLFFNVSTPAEWVAEYNCFYGAGGTFPPPAGFGRNLSYAEILDYVSDTLLGYLLAGDIDPLMFHQTNLRAYDGVHSLLGDLLDRTLQKYDALFSLPIATLSMDATGRRMADRMTFNAAGVTGRVVPGQSFTISTQAATRVPVTGVNAVACAVVTCESYGGQQIAWIALGPNQSLTVPLR